MDYLLQPYSATFRDLDRPNGRDPRVWRAWAFLYLKGYVVNRAPIDMRTRQSISTSDLFWAGLNFDNFFLKVLPAVAIRFPKSLEPREDWPSQVREIVRLLEFKVDGPGLPGVRMEEHRAWLEFQPKDGRVSRRPHKRAVFFLMLDTIREIEKRASEKEMTKSDYIEELIWGGIGNFLEPRAANQNPQAEASAGQVAGT